MLLPGCSMRDPVQGTAQAAMNAAQGMWPLMLQHGAWQSNQAQVSQRLLACLCWVHAAMVSAVTLPRVNRQTTPAAVWKQFQRFASKQKCGARTMSNCIKLAPHPFACLPACQLLDACLQLESTTAICQHAQPGMQVDGTFAN